MIDNYRISLKQYKSKVEDSQCLPALLCRKLEFIFNSDFSDVRIHVEPLDNDTVACAHGEHLYFAPGYYAPETRAGVELITHELAHVLQQRQGRWRDLLSGRTLRLQGTHPAQERHHSARRRPKGDCA